MASNALNSCNHQLISNNHSDIPYDDVFANFSYLTITHKGMDLTFCAFDFAISVVYCLIITQKPQNPKTLMTTTDLNQSVYTKTYISGCGETEKEIYDPTSIGIRPKP